MKETPFTFSRAQLREIDRRCVEEYHLPILVLMENAGRAVAQAALKLTHSGAVILAGPGNNGGDGLVAARHLHNAGVNVTILLLAPRDSYKNAAGKQLAIVDAKKLTVETLSPDHAEFRDWHVDAPPEDIIIDALFGTGLSRPVEGLAADIIRAANASRRKILAIDIPSGLDADTGALLGIAINAAQTVSFCGGKTGFRAAKAFTGTVSVADIGAPRELLAELAGGGGNSSNSEVV
jgi:NAD(P)H-hydrate epimerase